MEQIIDNRRITVIARGTSRDWEATDLATSTVMTIDELPQLLLTLIDSVASPLDIERVILDQAASPTEFLDLLTAMPPEFVGDAMMIRDDGRAFLSATARGGSRVLYALGAADVSFYLQANGLVPYEEQAQLRIA